MRTKIKRVLCMAMILCLFVSLLPNTAMIAEAASSRLTLSQLRQKFPQGKYWNHAGNPGSSNAVNNQNGYTSTPCSQHGVVGTSKQTCNGFQPGNAQLSWQCMGYAEKLGYDATGYNPRNNANGWYTYTSSSALDNLKPGDIVRYKNDGHSIYVIGVNGDTVTYTDCNSDGHCIIRWDVTISKSTLRSTFTHVRSAPFAISGDTVRESDSRFDGYLPIAAYPIPTGNISVYDVYGNKYSNRYITGQTDLCAIREIYTDGWCYVSYPSEAESDGWFEAYVPLTVFIDSTYTPEEQLVTNPIEIYRHSDLATKFQSISPEKKCLLVDIDKTNKSIQIICPYSDTLNVMGWVSVSTFAENPKKVHVSTNSVNLTLGGTASQEISVWDSGYYNGSVTYNWKRSNSNVSCSWGDWQDDGSCPLTFTANSVGTTEVTVSVKDADSDEILDSTVVTVTVTAKSYTISYNANGGTGVPSGQTKYHDTALTLSSTKPTRKGYTFLGWSTNSSATSASYQPGDSFTENANTTLYAVWAKGCEDGSHNYSYKVTTAPTTAANGKMVGTCSICSETTTLPVPKLSEVFYTYTIVKNATCTATGVGRYTFNNLSYGNLYFDNTIPATGHTYTNKVTAPTCTAQGYTTHSCACGYSYKDTYTNATGHTYTNKVTAPTCTAQGYTTHSCACGYSCKDTYTNATGHTYSYEVSKMPSTSATGILTGICSKCSGTESVTLPKLNTTDYNYFITQPATCTTNGIESYTRKTPNGIAYIYNVSIPATGHSYSYRATKVPTISATGTLTGTCSNCSGTTTVTLPKLTTSDYSYEVVKKPSYTQTGTGRYTWNVNTYGTFYFDVSIAKLAVEVVKIEIAKNPQKTTYKIGEALDTTGLNLRVTHNDGSVKTVTTGFTTSGFSSNVAGVKTVTVSYSGKTTTFTVTVEPTSTTEAKYEVTNASGTAGSTVEVYVSIAKNPGVISLRNTITYDTSALELVAVQDCGLLNGYTTPSATITSPYTLRWADSLATANNLSNGRIIKLTFHIKEDAKLGDYNISVNHVEARNVDGEKVTFNGASAKIQVVDCMTGDADGDNEITDWDGILLSRYLAGWTVSIENISAMDTDGDGEITDWDGVLLDRYLAGWNVNSQIGK